MVATRSAKGQSTLEPFLERGSRAYDVVSYSELQGSLRRSLIRSATDIAEVARLAESMIGDVRNLLKVKKAPAIDINSVRSGAVDAGVSGKNLLVGFCPVIVAVGSVFKGVEMKDSPLAATTKLARIFRDEEEGRKLANLIGFYLQFELARRLVEEGVDILIIDGPLALSKVHYSTISRDFSQSFITTYQEALNSLLALLSESRDAGVLTVGIVKRVRSSIIQRLLSLDGKLNDSVIASISLSVKEYTKPLPLPRDWSDIPGEAQWRGFWGQGLKPRAVFVKGNVKRVYRLEIPEYALPKLDYVVGALTSLADPKSGFPIPLSHVDRLARITEQTSNSAYLRLFKEVMLRLGPSAAQLLNIVTLQHGEV
ncbi:MAG: hypothetical protein DRO00_07390 [Thermoproteota archaeon]|nr:MAG: hypothetical protein DRO00_07390 [Candidatus Korarchaeota archaeon]